MTLGIAGNDGFWGRVGSVTRALAFSLLSMTDVFQCHIIIT